MLGWEADLLIPLLLLEDDFGAREGVFTREEMEAGDFLLAFAEEGDAPFDG